MPDANKTYMQYEHIIKNCEVHLLLRLACRHGCGWASLLPINSNRSTLRTGGL